MCPYCNFSLPWIKASITLCRKVITRTKMAAQHFINILEFTNVSSFKKKNRHHQQKSNPMTVIETSGPFDSTFSTEAKMQNWHHEA